MPTLTFDFVNTIAPESLALTAEEVTTKYLPGVSMCLPDGSHYSRQDIQAQVASAMQTVADSLAYPMTRRVEYYEQPYSIDAAQNWLYCQTAFPIRHPISMKIKIGTNFLLYEMQQEWLVTQTKVVSEQVYQRAQYVVPYVRTATGFPILPWLWLFPFNTNPLMVGLTTFYPGMFFTEYLTGFNPIPLPVIDLIGYLTAQNLLSSLGILIGTPGVASESIGIDGASQSISKINVNNLGPYGDRIMLLNGLYRTKMGIAKAKYSNTLSFTVA